MAPTTDQPTLRQAAPDPTPKTAPTPTTNTDKPTRPSRRSPRRWLTDKLTHLRPRLPRRAPKPPRPTPKTTPTPTVVVPPTATAESATDKPTITRANTPGRADQWYARLILVAPLVVAGFFQATAIHGLIEQAIWPIAVLFTLCWEGAAAFIARLYLRALLRGDSTITLRLGMLAYAAGSCALLWAELHHQGKVALLAAAIGVLTLSSIFLWSRHARDLHRDALHARGQVDAQAVKFSLLRWILCPRETPAAFRFGIKFSLSRLGPDLVLDHYRAWAASGRPDQWPPTSGPSPTATVIRPASAPTPDRPTPAPRPATPTPKPTPTPTPTPTSNVRPLVSPDKAAADRRIIDHLHAQFGHRSDYPDNKPSLTDIKNAADGCSSDRAIRLRKLLIADHAAGAGRQPAEVDDAEPDRAAV